ncbi:hypothetical protein QHI69_19455 [Burkholderia gladioli pv. gladioli]|uniref:ATP-grasp domain-containing protein n=2 Tax=Burkholderia gladioli TaxID=28095 RepID=A0A2A7S3D8_BURGA|nr:hypothetical protein [Burkholderia gladioli]AJW99311.1 D-ala D-ala ligase family protein [Burkholderia gladioli]AWY54930.1 hypothetical protein A8H28_28160 [Burkholderia gladioli pv. gladioli]MDJ1164071.1 hypothetical protein [Burkholderia gladioli pv. gladioli]PEH37939.1 hypothetical protein CRM94_26200 [Burkholderia gladioli]QPQ84298.1 hypothetical protein I6H08_04415 [Burkholderia gladioli]
MITESSPKVWDETILLVADATQANVPRDEFDRRIDQPLRRTVDAMHGALERCCKTVHRYSNLNDFTQQIGRYPNSLVFPYWFGQQSRSRHGLVPAICEAANTMFVGADAFAKVVCNDKELSKEICRQAGLSVPLSAVLMEPGDLRYADYLSLPVVVKPNYEGTSLGITQRNLCRTWAEVTEISGHLFARLGQPVIIEEFIAGREFSACMLGTSNQTVAINIGGWKIDGDPRYLDERLNTFDLKLPNERTFEWEALTQMFPQESLDAFRSCFTRLGKVELLRIDGRVRGNDVVILELTPDIYLGDDGEFCRAFGHNETNYDTFISRLVSNCLEGYKAGMPMC